MRTTLLFALVLAGCGDAPTPDEGGLDASTPIDAYVPPDAGPVCEGTPPRCDTHATADACSAAGCRRFPCSGTPTRCIYHDTNTDCVAATGCWWSYELHRCEGDPDSCGAHPDRNHCLWSGCDWSDDAPCTGEPRPCASLSASECLVAPGCSPVGASDAGPPDGGGDAGATGELDGGHVDASTDSGLDASTPDAGCPDVRGCDPIDPTTCPAGESCRTATTIAAGDHGNDWTCRPLAGVTFAEGEPCSDYDQCAPGTFCSLYGVGSANAVCRRLCESDAECSTDQLCSVAVSRLGRMQSCVGTCVDRAACDLIAQDCPDGQRCALFRDPHWTGNDYVTLCVPYGGSTDTTPCNVYYDCAPGSVCVQSAVGTTGTCRRVCDPRDPRCATSTACTGSFLDLAYCQ